MRGHDLVAAHRGTFKDGDAAAWCRALALPLPLRAHLFHALHHRRPFYRPAGNSPVCANPGALAALPLGAKKPWCSGVPGGDAHRYRDPNRRPTGDESLMAAPSSKGATNPKGIIDILLN